MHVGPNDTGKKRKEIPQYEYSELGKKLKDRTPRVIVCFQSHMLVRVRTRKIGEMNVGLRDWCRGQVFRFLVHWDLFWGAGDLYKRDVLNLNWRGTNILPGRFANATHVGLN